MDASIVDAPAPTDATASRDATTPTDAGGPDDVLIAPDVTSDSGPPADASTSDGGTCDAPRIMCGDTCVDPTTSSVHCGACDAACGMGIACTESVCAQCPVGEALCAGMCVDVQSSQVHCGRCGNRCIMGRRCDAGECT
ncbi:MAG: hypothetical protein AB8H86_17005 [Polyangiales bacterium]